MANSATADPCGMVPPIYVQGDVPLARIGAQKTYVFYKDGIETFVIRPGFQGKVEEFGMLIPFPTVPALRKVSDDIFPHIAKAIDPPEVVIDLRPRFNAFRSGGYGGGYAAQTADDASLALRKDQVRVVKEEAVGMYEVAVLEAGSAQALKKWMDEHGYVYPEGMDEACNDYVADGWCFVAVKTRVGAKAGVDPKPGQRSVDSKLPEGAEFDGHVQAMGFRFRVGELVVPMRLSAFNEGRLHNVVYLLTDEPSRIRSISAGKVVRQIPGEQLIKNVTDPLPLRVIGGTVKDIPKNQLRGLKLRRDPIPHNGTARDLFASDLLSVQRERLSHPHEEREKELLRIGERLGLRGPELDKLHEHALTKERERVVRTALDDLKGMTLTVIDGDFPRELLASQNLKFSTYRMPARRNSAESYDAKQMGPAGKKQGDVYYGPIGAIRFRDQQRGLFNTEAVSLRSLSIGTFLLVGLVLTVCWFRGGTRGKRLMMLLLAASAAFAVSVPDARSIRDASAAAEEPRETTPVLLRLLERELTDPSPDPAKVDDLVEAIVQQGENAVPHLVAAITKGDNLVPKDLAGLGISPIETATQGGDLAMRGWLIVCLAEIGGPEAENALKKLQQSRSNYVFRKEGETEYVMRNVKQPMLIRTWAAAARVQLADSTEELTQLAGELRQFPALNRPLRLAFLEQLSEDGRNTSAESLLQATVSVPQLRQALAPSILSRRPEELTTAMLAADNQQIRRQAAAYLATMAQQGNQDVAAAVARAYRFDPQANAVPWTGGPLFVPGINWSQSKQQARKLVGHLVGWHLWCEERRADQPAQRSALQRQIHNNLRSVQLAQAAGYQNPGFQEVGSAQWLVIWGGAAGRDEVQKLLEQMGVAEHPRYRQVLEALR